MKIGLAGNIHLLACCAFGLIYGILRINAKKKSPVYLLFSVFAILCAFLSRVYYTLAITFYGSLPDTFNVGFFGYAAVFLFFLFANMGQIDWIVDDKVSIKPVYRIVPAVLPAAEMAVGVIGLFTNNVSLAVRISYLCISVIAGFAGYFNIKHIIIPDVEFGIARAIRGYNIIAVFVGILSLAEIGLSVFGHGEFAIYVQIALGVLYAVMIPVLSREVRKWVQ